MQTHKMQYSVGKPQAKPSQPETPSTDFDLCILICAFKHVLNTKKLLEDKDPMCATA